MNPEQKQILRLLKIYLKRNPETRVGQAIDQLTYDKDSVPLYYLSDFEFLRSIKRHMKLAIILCFLCTGLFSQSDTLTHKGELKVVLTIPYAKNIEYWGNKGVAAVPVISSLETRIHILESKVSFHEMINRNCIKAQEEYRMMLQNAAGVNAKLEKELAETINERDVWHSRAKNRGQLITFGAVIVGLLGYIQIAN